MVEPSILRSGTGPAYSRFKLIGGKVFFLGSSEWPEKARKPLDPLLVAHESRPVDVFIVAKAEPEVLFGCCEIIVKLKANKLSHQVDLVASFQALLECIHELLNFQAGDFATEMNHQAGFGRLWQDFDDVGYSYPG